MRVLVAAFACRPGGGSEPGAGWALGRGRGACRPRRDPGDPTSEPEAIRPPSPQSLHSTAWIRILSGFPPRSWSSGIVRWDSGTAAVLPGLADATPREGAKLHGAQPFDIAHHATLTNDWIPSGLSRSGIPALVWGPLGGSDEFHASCGAFLGPRGRVAEGVRSLVGGGLHAWAGRVCARRAALLVAQNEDEAHRLRRWQRPVVVSPNVFLDPSWFTSPVLPGRAEPACHREEEAGAVRRPPGGLEGDPSRAPDDAEPGIGGLGASCLRARARAPPHRVRDPAVGTQRPRLSPPFRPSCRGTAPHAGSRCSALPQHAGRRFVGRRRGSRRRVPRGMPECRRPAHSGGFVRHRRRRRW